VRAGPIVLKMPPSKVDGSRLRISRTGELLDRFFAMRVTFFWAADFFARLARLLTFVATPRAFFDALLFGAGFLLADFFFSGMYKV
jgi:hypothetical protein